MGETIHYRERPSWLNYFGLLILAGVVLLSTLKDAAAGGIQFSGLLLLLATIGRYRRLYTVTDHRVIMRIGLIANKTNEMELRHIRGINVRQSIWQRLLGIGTVEIVSAADSGAEVVFAGIRDPVATKEKIRIIKGSS